MWQEGKGEIVWIIQHCLYCMIKKAKYPPITFTLTMARLVQCCHAWLPGRDCGNHCSWLPAAVWWLVSCSHASVLLHLWQGFWKQEHLHTHPKLYQEMGGTAEKVTKKPEASPARSTCGPWQSDLWRAEGRWSWQVQRCCSSGLEHCSSSSLWFLQKVTFSPDPWFQTIPM